MRKKSEPSQSSKTPAVKNKPDTIDDLPGWPGYRTRDRRSGYDPIDNRTEAAHFFGTFVQKLFTFQLRTRNPLHLSLLAVLGGLFILPLLLAIAGTANGEQFSQYPWAVFGVMGLIGIAALGNFVRNLMKFGG